LPRAGPARIIEIDRAGTLLHEIKLKVNHHDPHTDTRLARKLDDGHYLVCHEGDGVVREYDHKGRVTWDYSVPLFGGSPKPGHGPEAYGNKCFAAVRLPNGNTLISTGNGHGVIEVTPLKQIVWKIQQRDLPKITLAWVTTLEVLPNGHYVIGNCHAGPGQPLVIELDPKTKKVVWTFDQFETYGNRFRTHRFSTPTVPSSADRFGIRLASPRAHCRCHWDLAKLLERGGGGCAAPRPASTRKPRDGAASPRHPSVDRFPPLDQVSRRTEVQTAEAVTSSCRSCDLGGLDHHNRGGREPSEHCVGSGSCLKGFCRQG
jgi:hypothetical protein